MIAATLLVVSCDDFLNEAPVMQQSTELSLATYGGLDNATFAAYAPLVSTNWYGASFIIDASCAAGTGIATWIKIRVVTRFPITSPTRPLPLPRCGELPIT